MSHRTSEGWRIVFVNPLQHPSEARMAENAEASIEVFVS